VSRFKYILILLALISVIIQCGFVCQSSDTSRDGGMTTDTLNQSVATAKQQADVSQKPAVRTIPEPQTTRTPTTIKPNITRIMGTVKSMVMKDTVDFSISAHIDSAAAIGEMPSFAEPGSDVVLVPRYIFDASGFVDISNDRNQRLFRLRTLKEGSRFHGKIARQPNGDWTIVDADTI